MTTALSQPDDWYTARQLADRFRLRLDQLGLQRLGTRAASIARRLSVPPRKVPERQPHMVRAVDVNAFPFAVWVEAYQGVKAPEGLAAKPVTFNGVRFRSTLEGRTAAFFAGMEYTYEYEPAWLELPSGRYRPDFRVLIRGYWNWWEVKSPHVLSEGRDPRWSETVRATGLSMFVSYGLWRSSPFPGSEPARIFRGIGSGGYGVRWYEQFGCFPDRQEDPSLRDRLREAYRTAADERFGSDDGLSFTA